MMAMKENNMQLFIPDAQLPAPTPPQVVSLDVGYFFGVAVLDASGGDFIFTDDYFTPTVAVLRGLSAGDRIELSGPLSQSEVYFTEYGDGNVVVTYNDGAHYAEIVLEGAMHGSGFVYDYATAVAAVGFDFMVIA